MWDFWVPPPTKELLAVGDCWKKGDSIFPRSVPTDSVPMP